MSVSSPLFDINKLNDEEQMKFNNVYNELKCKYKSYLEYKINLELENKFHIEEEENEWNYEIHRFLRARKWNITNTIKSLNNMIEWRINNHADSILEDNYIIQRMNILKKIIPNNNHGYTKDNKPLYIEKSGQINVDQLLNQFTGEELIKCHIYWLEFICRLARQRSQQLGIHIENFALIYDLHQCKIDIRKIIHLFKESLYIDENYYPERLGQMFMVNPPTIFPVLWNLVKHLFDPITKSKIHVIKKGNDTSITLLQYIHQDHLPFIYGGNCQSCTNSPDCIPVFNNKH